MESGLNRLRITTLVVWLAWLASLLVMGFIHQWRVMHPHFAPFVSTLLIQIVGGLVLLAQSIWLLARTSNRRRVVGWLLLGTTPIWLWAAYYTYGSWRLIERISPLGMPERMLAEASMSVIDLAARLRFSNRHEGRHVIMICDEADNPNGQLELIDRHVDRLEAILGRSSPTKLHWVRGPIVPLPSFAGWYCQGLSIGSGPADAVTDIDRHELAHGVIDQQCGSDWDAPSVLVEGWAESQSGYAPDFLATRAWQFKQIYGPLSAWELISNPWYHAGKWPVYFYGGALVQYLLETYGGETFLELYTTCRRQTFAEDCHRVLGLNIDELDRDYWEFVEQKARLSLKKGSSQLADISLADNVDRQAWLRFASEYPNARRQSQAPLDQIRVEYSSRQESPATDSPVAMHVELIRDGGRQRMTITTNNEQQYAVVAGETKSFCCGRLGKSKSWTLDRSEDQGHALLDASKRKREIEAQRRNRHGALHDILQNEFIDRSEFMQMRVTRFSPWESSDGPMIELDYEYSRELNPPVTITGHFLLLQDRNWATKEYEIRTISDTRPSLERTILEYESGLQTATIPRLMRRHFESTTSQSDSEIVLERLEFQSADDSLFRPESFGIAGAELEYSHAWPWFVTIPVIVAPAWLFLGLLMLVLGRKHDAASIGNKIA